jgi:hypothetical protein
LTPQTSTSANQVFTLRAQQGSQPVFRVLLLFNTGITGTDDCQVLLQTSGSNVWTAKLSPTNWYGSDWLGPVTLGQAGTLTNGRCSLNAGASSWAGSGADLSWNLSMSRTVPGWNGNKKAYMMITTDSGLEDGWSEIGAWNVP